MVGALTITPGGNDPQAVANPLETRRGYPAFGVLTWASAMLVGVVGSVCFSKKISTRSRLRLRHA